MIVQGMSVPERPPMHTDAEWKEIKKAREAVERPPHYTDHPSGVECIVITEHMTFLRGNAMKYLWRAGSKGSELEDLKKARWYIDREIANLQKKEAGA